jgi:hypothetical protein
MRINESPEKRKNESEPTKKLIRTWKSGDERIWFPIFVRLSNGNFSHSQKNYNEGHQHRHTPSSSPSPALTFDTHCAIIHKLFNLIKSDNWILTHPNGFSLWYSIFSRCGFFASQISVAFLKWVDKRNNLITKRSETKVFLE